MPAERKANIQHGLTPPSTRCGGSLPRVAILVATALVAAAITAAHAQQAPLRGPLDGPDLAYAGPAAAMPPAPPAMPGEVENGANGGRPASSVTGVPPLPPPAPQAAAPLYAGAPQGLPVGAFRLRSTLEADAIVTDNVNQTPHDRRADIGERMRATLRLSSVWPRHALDLSASVDHTAFARNGLDDLSASLAADLRLDLRGGVDGRLHAGYALDEETDGPERLVHTLTGEAGLAGTAGRLRPSVSASVSRVVYGDTTVSGTDVKAGDDDYVEPAVTLRLAMDAGGRLRPFVEASGSLRLHDRKRDASGVPRDSKGGYVEAGVEIDDAIWSGRLALRYAMRDYDDPATDTVRGIGVDAALQWRPTRLTTVDFGAGLGIDDTSVAGSRAVRRYRGSMRLRHALRDDLTIGGSVEAEYADYAASPDHELTLRGGLETAWQWRPELALVAGWTIERQWSTFAGGDYLENRVRLGLRYRL